ncbi:MAG: AmmeMemoRadiSam system radical SAM enzyme [Spirochaetes bacterium]|nr:AmmeMemoRadiSam system radical SAM enzyme [Spirochaetota bacterium]
MREKSVTPLFFELPADNVNTGKCVLCPNYCIIKAGGVGRCRVRGFDSSLKPIISSAGRISALALDPMEKKPLYHFYPGTQILSVGFFGCSLFCPFCQNYHISTKVPRCLQADPGARIVSPEEMLEIAVSSGSIGLAYTYSEPIIHIEWVKKTAALLRSRNLKNVLITNGYITTDAGKSILEHIDALNIDLKSFNDDFYCNELGGRLESVKDFIKLAASKAHIEVTTLVISGKNDSEKEIEAIACFIASIDKSIPLHLSCYYPTYKYSTERTSAKKVLALAAIAAKYLEYVYVGNAGLVENNTNCPSCGNLLVKRAGYNAELKGIKAWGSCQANTSEQRSPSGVCSNCGKKIFLIN